MKASRAPSASVVTLAEGGIWLSPHYQKLTLVRARQMRVAAPVFGRGRR
jgi:hypothetical protein